MYEISSRLIFVEQSVHMEKGEVHTGLWWGNQKERDCLEELNMQGRIILRCFTLIVLPVSASILSTCL
jgi:hypothetical protein